MVVLKYINVDDDDDDEDADMGSVFKSYLAFANWMKSALATLPSSFFNFDALFSSRFT